MQDYQEKAANRRSAQRDEPTAAEDLLREPSVDELRPRPGSERLAPADSQQQRTTTWRWHVRRRPRS